MRVIQISPSVSHGDAIGRNIIALSKIISSLGHKSEIYVEFSDFFYDLNTVKLIYDFPPVSKNDIVIYHLSTAFNFVYNFAKLPCKKIVVYHNVTPSSFFETVNFRLFALTKQGHREVRFLSDKVDYCLAVSDFNKHDLLNLGYKCPVDVLPILIQKEDYMQVADENILKKYKDGWTNIIFTGRVVPNKKQEDVIAAFGWYKKYINEKSRLFLVGSYEDNNLYYRQLMQFIEKNKIEDVIFTGHVTFSEILAYYKCADLFLCMSEHEGFCVPIVEAMIFDLPIVAYDMAAVGETLGGGGLLIKDKDPVFVAKCMERLLIDKKLQEHFRKAQKKRLDDFSYENVSSKFIDYLSKI